MKNSKNIQTETKSGNAVGVLPPPAPMTLEKLLTIVASQPSAGVKGKSNTDINNITQLDLSKRGITKLPSNNLSTIFMSLRKLSLSRNHIVDITPLRCPSSNTVPLSAEKVSPGGTKRRDDQHNRTASRHSPIDTPVMSFSASLTNLDLSHNTKLACLESLITLTSLTVINISYCNVSSLRGLEGSYNTIAALVANDNNIVITSPSDATGSTVGKDNWAVLTALAGCIETIVLSRNPNLTSGYELLMNTSDVAEEEEEINKKSDTEQAVADQERILPDPNHPLHVFSSFVKLRKLSASECGIKCLPRKFYLPLLTELRLAKNHITNFSGGVLLRSIKIIDISHNQLNHYRALRRCKFLSQLSIKGNPLANVKLYQETLKKIRETEAPDNNDDGKEAPADIGLFICPMEVLFLRNIFPLLEVLDSKKLPKASYGDIKSAIGEMIKVKHSANGDAEEEYDSKNVTEAPKVKKTTEKNTGRHTIGTGGKQENRQGYKTVSDMYGQDPEEMGHEDFSIALRKRRRKEECEPHIIQKESKGNDISHEDTLAKKKPITPIATAAPDHTDTYDDGSAPSNDTAVASIGIRRKMKQAAIDACERPEESVRVVPKKKDTHQQQVSQVTQETDTMDKEYTFSTEVLNKTLDPMKAKNGLIRKVKVLSDSSKDSGRGSLHSAPCETSVKGKPSALELLRKSATVDKW